MQYNRRITTGCGNPPVCASYTSAFGGVPDL